jgi:O-antigen/teichoic acid export membrane protein
MAIALGTGFIWFDEKLLMISAVAFQKALDFSYETLFGGYLRIGRTKDISSMLLCRSIGALVISPLVLIYTRELEYAVLAWAVIDCQLFTYNLIRSRKLLGDVEHKPLLARLRGMQKIIVVGIPAGIRTTLTSLNTSIPRYFLEIYRSTEELGTYVAFFHLLQIGDLATSSLANAAIPRLTQAYSENRRQFWLALTGLAALCFLLGISFIPLLMWKGEEIISFIFTPDFAKDMAPAYVLLLAGAVRFALGVFCTASMIMRILVQELFVISASVLVGLLLGMYLINANGLLGASWSLLISSAVNLGLLVGLIVHVSKRGRQA